MSAKDDKTQIYLPDKPESTDPFAGRGMSGGLPKARLVCLDVSHLDDGATSLVIPLSTTPVTLGRGQGNTVTVNSSQLSRQHAKIFPSNDRWGIEDLGSRNGTWVNDARVEQAFLKAGDTVKIGPIPFKFELDRPEVSSSTPIREDSTIVDKTMLVGSDVRAASALLKAAKKRDTDEPEPEPARPEVTPTASARRAVEAASGRHAQAQKKKGRLVQIGIGSLLALAVVYGVFDFIRNGERRDAIATFDTEIKAFLKDYELGTAATSAANESEAPSIARDLVGRVTTVADKYPDSPELYRQRLESTFLAYERELAALLKRGAVAEARALQQRTEQEIEALTVPSSMDGEVIEQVDGLRVLFKLSAAVVELRAFRLRYPAPGPDATAKPSPEELDAAVQHMDRFAIEKRRSNLVLSIRYMYFLNVVREVDDTDLRVINRWRELR